MKCKAVKGKKREKVLATIYHKVLLLLLEKECNMLTGVSVRIGYNYINLSQTCTKSDMDKKGRRIQYIILPIY